MYKLIAHPQDYLLKSFDILDLWRFVISNPKWTYQFYIDYSPITNEEFMSCFFKENKIFKNYLDLYQTLNPAPTIYEYLKMNNTQLLNNLKNNKNVTLI